MPSMLCPPVAVYLPKRWSKERFCMTTTITRFTGETVVPSVPPPPLPPPLPPACRPRHPSDTSARRLRNREKKSKRRALVRMDGLSSVAGLGFGHATAPAARTAPEVAAKDLETTSSRRAASTRESGALDLRHGESNQLPSSRHLTLRPSNSAATTESSHERSLEDALCRATASLVRRRRAGADGGGNL